MKSKINNKEPSFYFTYCHFLLLKITLQTSVDGNVDDESQLCEEVDPTPVSCHLKIYR